MVRTSAQIEIDKFKRDPGIRKIVSEHSKMQPWRQIFALAGDWALIIGMASLCANYFSWWLYAATVVVIAARQHALLILMHEAAHMRIFKNLKYGDFVGDFFCAYPILMTTDFYRRHHSAHHSATNTDKDPDWVRKITMAEWQYPQTSRAISKTLLRQLFFRGGQEWVVFMVKMSKGEKKKYLYWASVLTAVVLSGFAMEFALYWVVPLLTVFPLIQRVRSISEHFGLRYEHELNDTRNVLVGPVQAFLFAPHNINFHLLHHLFATVPQYNLKKLHKELSKNPLYAQLAHNNASYIFMGNSVFSDLTKYGTVKQDEVAKSA